MMLGHILEIPFDVVDVDMGGGAHMEPDFLEKNPMHSVPVIEDRGFILAESHAIVIYLVSKYGADKRSVLYPSDLYDRATIDSRLHFDNGILFQKLKALTAPGVTGPDQQLVSNVEEAYQMIEMYLQKTKYVAMDHFTIADVSVGATTTALNSVIPIDCDRFPRLIEWFGAIHAESCFPDVNTTFVQDLNTFLNDIWVNNQSAVNVTAR